MTAPLGSRKRPYPRPLRKSMCDYGHRPLNEWGGGDLPAPFAAGDLLRLADPVDVDQLDGRLRGMEAFPGSLFIVTSGYSIDEGDGWYFRASNGRITRDWRGKPYPEGSDRLHVIPDVCDYMAQFTLVETVDPEGLALRQKMLAEGWSYTPPPTCPTCGQEVPT